MSKINPINRAEFTFIFDVKDGNPNGDPDAGNLPRIDPETGHGLVTDVSIKRKIRNYVGMVKGELPPYEIYIKEKAVLNKTHERAYRSIKADTSKAALQNRKGSGEEVLLAREWMCNNFYDVRTFGAVMSTGVNCGQVRGPVQLTFARSVEPIVTLEHTITRMAVTTERESNMQSGENLTMARKNTIPYGLYVAHGFISGYLAKQTGFSIKDRNLLFDALSNMFEHDRSATRGEMTTRGLYVFQHDSLLGNAPAHTLLDRVKIFRPDASYPARSFSDYIVQVDANNIPEGVKLEKIV
jgi:CRISPR-associated protein Csd2